MVLSYSNKANLIMEMMMVSLIMVGTPQSPGWLKWWSWSWWWLSWPWQWWWRRRWCELLNDSIVSWTASKQDRLPPWWLHNYNCITWWLHNCISHSSTRDTKCKKLSHFWRTGKFWKVCNILCILNRYFQCLRLKSWMTFIRIYTSVASATQ